MSSNHFRINHRHQAPQIIAGSLIGCSLLVGFFSFFHVFSITNHSASAFSTDSTADMSVSLEPAIEVWTTAYDSTAQTPCTSTNISEVNIAADPDEQVYTGDACVHVSTNAVKGYTLTMASSTTTAKMVHEIPTVSATIDPLTNSTSHATVTTDGISTTDWAADSALNGMWGYDLNSADTYKPVATSSSSNTLGSTTAPASNSTHHLTYGTKIDISQPAGEYNNTVIFSAVANVDTDNYMQEFTANKCNALAQWSYDGSTVTPGTTSLLYDERTGQDYKVRRLADGNCWMVDNLYLTGGTILTPALTDIESDTVSYYMDGSTSTGSYTIPDSVSGTVDGNATFNTNRSYDMNNGSIETGSYYSWLVATAGIGSPYGDGSRQDPTASICPRGWKLPTASHFQSLYSAYGSNYTNFAGSGDNSSATRTGAPWNFRTVGRWYDGAIGSVSTDAIYWSRAGYDADRAFSLYMVTTDAGSAFTYSKFGGRSVRCVFAGPSS